MSSHNRRAAGIRRAWGRGPIILKLESLERRELLAASAVGGKPPRLGILVSIDEAYTHFAGVPTAAMAMRQGVKAMVSSFLPLWMPSPGRARRILFLKHRARRARTLSTSLSSTQG